MIKQQFGAKYPVPVIDFVLIAHKTKPLAQFTKQLVYALFVAVFGIQETQIVAVFQQEFNLFGSIAGQCTVEIVILKRFFAFVFRVLFQKQMTIWRQCFYFGQFCCFHI